MRKLVLLAAVVGVVLLLGSCLQVKTVINVNSDGSGTVDQSLLMKSEMIDMMAGLSSMGDSEKSAQKNTKKFTLFDERQLRENAATMGPDVTVVKAEPIATDWGKGYHVVYSFKDINKIRVNQNPGDDLSAQMESNETKPQNEASYLQFSFKRGDPDTLTVQMPEKSKSEVVQTAPGSNESSSKSGSTAMSDEDIAMFTQFYTDMRIGVAITLNGTIVSTNATFHDANSVTLMDFQFNSLLKNPDFLKELKAGDSAKMGDFQSLARMFPGLKIEPRRTVQITFR